MDGAGGAPAELSPDLSLPLWDTSLGGGCPIWGILTCGALGARPVQPPPAPLLQGSQAALNLVSTMDRSAATFPGGAASRGLQCWHPSGGFLLRSDTLS